MKIPSRMMSLVEEGLVDEVLHQLMTGKEAEVYMVLSQGQVCCAKIYKEVNKRNFKHNTDYTEGRRVKNSRRARAMGKKTRFGAKEMEDAWQNAEVEALTRLASAGVRVPQVYGFYDGVLLMELVTDHEGDVAPRLHDLEMTVDQAHEYFLWLIQEIVRMLCAGLIHGDLSEYNILFGKYGPVIIDLPQAVDASANNNAKKLLERDVDNVKAYFSRFAPELKATQYGKEMWDLYKNGKLHPETKLTGRFKSHNQRTDVGRVLQVITDAREDKEKKNNG